MKSITIHHINDELEQQITAKSREWGLSLNKTIKRLLENALGPSREEIAAQRRKELLELRESAPKWTKEEWEEFDAMLKEADEASMETDEGSIHDQQ